MPKLSDVWQRHDKVTISHYTGINICEVQSNLDRLRLTDRLILTRREVLSDDRERRRSET